MHINTFLFKFFSIMVYHRVLNIVLILYSRTLLFIHLMYSSLHLLIPNSVHPSSTQLPFKSQVFSLLSCFVLFFSFFLFSSVIFFLFHGKDKGRKHSLYAMYLLFMVIFFAFAFSYIYFLFGHLYFTNNSTEIQTSKNLKNSLHCL